MKAYLRKSWRRLRSYELREYTSKQLNQIYTERCYESISTFTDPNFVKKCFAASPRFIGTLSFCSCESLVCNKRLFLSRLIVRLRVTVIHSRGEKKCFARKEDTYLHKIYGVVFTDK